MIKNVDSINFYEKEAINVLSTLFEQHNKMVLAKDLREYFRVKREV